MWQFVYFMTWLVICVCCCVDVEHVLCCVVYVDVRYVLESDQTQLLVEVPAISYFTIPTDGKGVLVWFHFLLAAGKLLTGNF